MKHATKVMPKKMTKADMNKKMREMKPPKRKGGSK